MFKNLNAEERRHDETNITMAAFLGVDATTYARKKKLGTFTINEAKRMMKKFDKDFDYLFAVTSDEKENG